MGNVESTTNAVAKEASSSSSSSSSYSVVEAVIEKAAKVVEKPAKPPKPGKTVAIDKAKDVRNFYTRLASVPALSGGWLIKNEAQDILIQYTQADLERGVKRQFLIPYREAVSVDAKSVNQTSPFPLEISGALDIVPSPSGRYLAVVRENDAAKTAENLNNKSFATIEIWSGTRVLQTLATQDLGHGKIYKGLKWNSNEKSLVYIAETPSIASKSSAFFPPSKTQASAVTPDSASHTLERGTVPVDLNKIGNKFLFTEDFGEQNTNNRQSELWLLHIGDLEDEEFPSSKLVAEPWLRACPIKFTDPTLSVSQPRWAPDGTSLVFVGTHTDHRRLGQIYCGNRSSGVYFVSIKAELEALRKSAKKRSQDTSEKGLEALVAHEAVLLSNEGRIDFSARAPFFSPDGHFLLYITSASDSMHNSQDILRCISWDIPFQRKVESRTVLAEVRTAKEGDFPGFYDLALPASCWIDERHFIASTTWHSQIKMVIVDITTGSVKELGSSDLWEKGSSVNVLSVDRINKNILIGVSAPNRPKKAFLGHWKKDTEVEWVAFDHQSLFKSAIVGHIHSIKWEVKKVATSTKPIEYIHLKPPQKERAPVLLYPHGGPHAVFTTSYMSQLAYLCLLGNHIVLTNYRGSTGFESEEVESLSGRIGTQDVQDCMACLLDAINHKSVDDSRICAIGGSHGGFLTAHLIAQYPDTFKCAVLRNPVINLPTMYGTTDIPEWDVVEGCGMKAGSLGPKGLWLAFGEKGVELELNEERILRMFQVSPMYHIAKIKTPSLILIGKNDRRVPPTQGREFFYALQARGVPTRMLIYDDPHAIEKVESEIDAWLNVSIWFNQYL